MKRNGLVPRVYILNFEQQAGTNTRHVWRMLLLRMEP